MPADELLDDAQVYTRLQERLGLKNHAMVLNVMLSKIATNLKVYGSCDDIITQTLNLFQVCLLYVLGANSLQVLSWMIAESIVELCQEQISLQCCTPVVHSDGKTPSAIT